jgi:hypothetical protein
MSLVLEKGKSCTGSPELLSAPLSKLVVCTDIIFFLLLTRLGGHTFGGKAPHLPTVFQNALT